MSIYELVGGPFDGEAMKLREEAVRIGIPVVCDKGCCAFYELYDWTEESDKKGTLQYAGREEPEEIWQTMFDSDYRDNDSDHYQISEPPILLRGTIREEHMWDIWDAGEESDYDD